MSLMMPRSETPLCSTRPRFFQLLGRKRARALADHDAGEADDGVEWCPELVRHRREKRALRAVGAHDALPLALQRTRRLFELLRRQGERPRDDLLANDDVRRSQHDQHENGKEQERVHERGVPRGMRVGRHVRLVDLANAGGRAGVEDLGHQRIDARSPLQNDRDVVP